MPPRTHRVMFNRVDSKDENIVKDCYVDRFVLDEDNVFYGVVDDEQAQRAIPVFQIPRENVVSIEMLLSEPD